MLMWLQGQLDVAPAFTTGSVYARLHVCVHHQLRLHTCNTANISSESRQERMNGRTDDQPERQRCRTDAKVLFPVTVSDLFGDFGEETKQTKTLDTNEDRSSKTM